MDQTNKVVSMISTATVAAQKEKHHIQKLKTSSIEDRKEINKSKTQRKAILPKRKANQAKSRVNAGIAL